MFADERKAEIVSYVEQHRRVTVADLARMFSSSESTIRRDLQELEEMGQIKRTHGGAVALEVAGFEPTWQEKDAQYSDAKQQIGRACAQMIQSGQTILLDSGTTTMQLARNISAKNVTVVTNSVHIAHELATSRDVHLVMLGGELRPTTGAFVGPFTEAMLKQLHVDIAFLGTNGLDENGITTPNAAEAATKRVMISAADEVVLAADHSKIGQVSFVRVCTWQDINTFVTDEDVAEEELLQVLRHHGVDVRSVSASR